MLWSRLFIPTLRDDPAEAEAASHRLLLRAGYIRQSSSGLYSYLFLAQRCFRKIESIIRQEMDAIGAQELFFPGLHPVELWQESGRWGIMGDDLFHLNDRSKRAFCLGTANEEVVTALARGQLQSYKQLPQIWYQIQTRYRDEPRPRTGLIRARQFRVTDSCSLDIDAAGLDGSYHKHFDAYGRILNRCGLPHLAVEAGFGPSGGGSSRQFAIVSDAGEDALAVCQSCGYAASLETAAAVPLPQDVPDPAGDLDPEPFHTPGQKTIADVSRFTALPETCQMKSLVLVAHGKPVLVLLRGDHQLSPAKFAAVSGDPEFRPARSDEILEWFGAGAGSLGPVGVDNMTILMDQALAGRRNMICGANRDDYHLRHVTPFEDFQAETHDLRAVSSDDLCARCGHPIDIRKSIEVGHILKLGTEYSESMGLRVLNPEGREVMPLMGSYRLGIERILCAAIELFHDRDGIVLPPQIAPFHVIVTPANNSEESQRMAARSIYDQCLSLGLDALLDDRDERPGVKFKDADLIGVPFRITAGKKLASGLVELMNRKNRQSTDVPVSSAATAVPNP